MGEINLFVQAIIQLAIFISITYIVVNLKPLFKGMITNVSNKDKLFFNLIIIIIMVLGTYLFKGYNLGLHYLIILLVGRLFGFPYGLINGVVMAIFSYYLKTNLYPLGLESLLLGIVIDNYNIIKLNNINFKLKRLIISLLLAVTLVLQDKLILSLFFNIIIFWSVLSVIDIQQRRLKWIYNKERELNDINLTCSSLTGLHDINKKLSSKFTLKDTYETLIEIGCEKLGVKVGGLLAQSEEEDAYLDIKSLKGLDKGLHREYWKKVKVKKGDKYFGYNLNEGEIVIINSLKKDNHSDTALFVEGGFNSMLLSPIFVDDNFAGIIFFLHQEESFFNNFHMVAIKTVVEQSPLAIEKAEFFEKMERNMAGLSTLQRTSNTINSTLNLDEVIDLTVDVILGTMGVSMAGLFLLDQQDNKLKLVSSIGVPDNKETKKLIELAERTADNLIQNNSVLITDKVSEDIKNKFETLNLISAVCIPLKVRDNMLGAITAAQLDFPRNFKEADKSFLTTLANQIAIAIENATMYKQMEDLATRDGLTKLYNHSYFQDALREEIFKAKESKTELSLMMMDIDNFKEFNDTYGHQVGDKVLKSLARLLKEEARDLDIVARYGGEEFAIILPKTDSATVLAIGERLNDLVRNMVVEYDNLRLKVTISIGAAYYKAGLSQKELINAADTALYQAKRRGKDQTCLTEYKEIAFLR
ncbi:hypothetical protein U472_08725 [Orenia metallireducens]|uniref:GGDEF domain-containing protein n=1 Tax=Orenia metallireducens TaxID=1413210 RepID=A0A1C0A778_9FIRM|nr:diguanylate cyclase [Orenia metallireducens]OCL26090.1 hypothetical protein U472_08725 [Orenia metallireducens]